MLHIDNLTLETRKEDLREARKYIQHGSISDLVYNIINKYFS